MDLEVTGELWFGRGPAPFHVVTVPDEQCGPLEAVSPRVSDGWGMIPVAARIGRAQGLELGDEVTVHLAIDV